MSRRGALILSFIALAAFLGASIFISASLFARNRALSSDLVREGELAAQRAAFPPEFFMDADGTDFMSGEEVYFEKKKQFQAEGGDFIDVDLNEMKLRLYEKGRERETLPVL